MRLRDIESKESSYALTFGKYGSLIGAAVRIQQAAGRELLKILVDTAANCREVNGLDDVMKYSSTIARDIRTGKSVADMLIAMNIPKELTVVELKLNGELDTSNTVGTKSKLDEKVVFLSNKFPGYRVTGRICSFLSPQNAVNRFGNVAIGPQELCSIIGANHRGVINQLEKDVSLNERELEKRFHAVETND